jgi:hypothetical protein
MGEPARPTGSSTSAPQSGATAEQRTCVKCGETKVATPELWPYRKGRTRYAAFGGRCMVCYRKAKAEYEKRRDKIAALVKDVPAVPATGKDDKDKQKAALATSRLDVAKALKAGGKVLNEYAPSILARVLEWAEDEDHENHLWAVQFMAERIVPRKLYEELGAQAAGVGSMHDKRPQFVIQVLPAQAGPLAPEPRVIEGESEVVQVLPAPQQS